MATKTTYCPDRIVPKNDRCYQLKGGNQREVDFVFQRGYFDHTFSVTAFHTSAFWRLRIEGGILEEYTGAGCGKSHFGFDAC